MSDKLNPNDQELTFKERILRDLEMLKTQVEETDDVLFEKQQLPTDAQHSDPSHVGDNDVERLKAEIASRIASSQ